MPSRYLLAGLLLTAALPALGQDQVPPFALTARMGAHLPARLFSPFPPELRVGPSVELAVSRALLPWLEVELAAGWSRSEAPTESYMVSSNPNDPLSPIVRFDLSRQLTTVPLTLGLRLAWPAPLAVRPYAVAGGGAVYAEYLVESSATGFSTGWGTEGYAGLGVDTRIGPTLVLGLEGRWRRAGATLHQHRQPPLYASWGASAWDANLGGFCAQATAGWRF